MAGLVVELRAGGLELAGPASVADADDLRAALQKQLPEWGISCQLCFLPTVVPLRSSLAAGIAVLDCDRLQAPEDVIGGLLADEVLNPGQAVKMRDGKCNGDISHRVWLPWMSTLLLRCGYELVAPQKFAEKAAAWDGQRSDLYNSFRRLSMSAQGLPLIFLPGSQLTSDQHLCGDVQPDESSQPHGHVLVEVSTSGLATLLEAPQGVEDLVWQAFRRSLEENPAKLHDATEVQQLQPLILAAIGRLGYELVAPAALAASAPKRDEHIDFEHIAREASKKQSPLAFLPRATLCTEQRLLIEHGSREGFHPSGMIAVEVDAKGIPNLLEAPEDMRSVLAEAFPWSQGSTPSSLKRSSVDLAPKVCTLLLASITQLGYELVAPKELAERALPGAGQQARPGLPDLGALGSKHVLIFLPSASLTAERCARLDIQPVETFSPSGHVRIDFSPTNVATLREAPSELRRIIQESFPWGKYMFELSFVPKVHALFLALIKHLGYELVAPRVLAAHERAAEAEQSHLQQLAIEASSKQLPLVFLPQASLATEQCLPVEFISRQGFCPSGVVTMKVDAKGIPTLHDAPQDVKDILSQALPWSCGSTLASMKRIPADVAPKVHESMRLALERLGYELVAPKEPHIHPAALDASGSELLLVFLPRATLTTDQRMLLDVESKPDYCPPGHVKVEVGANGVATLLEAPEELNRVMEEAFPWSHGECLSKLKGISLDFLPKVHTLLLTSITQLGYELVAPKELAERVLPGAGQLAHPQPLELGALDSKQLLIFLPSASLTPERCVQLDIQPVQNCRPSGHVRVDFSPTNVAILREAPCEIRRVIQEAFPCGKHLFELSLVPKVHALFLAFVKHLGYKLVAPKVLAAREVAAEEEQCFLQQLAIEASSKQLPLVFLPQASLATEQCLPIELIAREGFCPSEMVTMKVDAKGIATLHDAPQDVKDILSQALPWSCGSTLASLKRIPADFAPKVHELMLLAMERLGYELVAPKEPYIQPTALDASSSELLLVFLPRATLTTDQRMLLDVESKPDYCPPGHVKVEVGATGVATLVEAPDELRSVMEEAFPWSHGECLSKLKDISLDFLPKVHELILASIERLGYDKVTGPSGTVAGTHRFLRPSRSLAATQEPSAAQMVEALRAELEAKIHAQAEETALVKAQLGEALGTIESQKADLGILQEQVGTLMEDKREREEVEAVAAKADADSQERDVPTAQRWPVQVSDVDSGTASAAKHIRIECPGVQEDDYTIVALPNGVHVHIKAPDSSREDFDRDFYFTREGFFELREKESSHDLGVILLVLKATTPPPRRRIKLSSASRVPLPPVPEEAQGDASRGANQHPQRFDIASDSPCDADSQSATSEAVSWMHVNGGAGACAYPEQDAASVGEESSGQVSQLSSWVVPVDSQRAASRAPSSHCSGVSSAVTVRSVASAPAKLSTPCCFPPKTRFRSATTPEKYVSAGQLKSSGGDRLLGPGGAEVLVRKANRHRAAKRNLVSLRVKGVSEAEALVVTTDHRLLTRGPDGQPVTCTAGSLAGKFSQGVLCHLHDGSTFQDVEQADCYSEECEVVEVTFDGDDVALAWVLSRRSRSIDSEVSVAVRGKEHMLDDHFDVKGTFICERSKACIRSHSAGASPLYIGAFSLGSRGHDDDHPERCSVCPKHKGFLKAWNSPNWREAKPCPDGASCRMCHEPHGEHVTLRRSRGRGGRRAAEVQPPAEVQPQASSMTGR